MNRLLLLVCPASRIRGALLSALSLSCFSGVVLQVQADDQSIPRSAVQQALVNPRTIRLPVIEGKDIRFTRLSTENGLSQTRVSQIVQDDQGFMWFGTQYGLNRYDGYKFKIFKHEPGR